MAIGAGFRHAKTTTEIVVNVSMCSKVGAAMLQRVCYFTVSLQLQIISNPKATKVDGYQVLSLFSSKKVKYSCLSTLSKTP